MVTMTEIMKHARRAVKANGYEGRLEISLQIHTDDLGADLRDLEITGWEGYLDEGDNVLFLYLARRE